MKITTHNGVILCSLKLNHQGREPIIDNMVLDTGASETLIYRHALHELDIHIEKGDEFVFMRGIGGREASFRKQIGSIEFAGFTAVGFKVDFTDADERDINGLIGLDLLTAGRFIIDLDAMVIHSKF